MGNDESVERDDGLEYPSQEWLTPEQRARERGTWRWLILGGIVILALFLVAFWPVMAGRLNAAKQLDEAQALLGQARSPVDGIDKVVTTQISPDAVPSAPDLAPEILVARRELNQTVSLIGVALPHLTEDEQSRGNLILSAAQARLVMIDRAQVIISTSEKAVKAKSLADAGWEQLATASAEETQALQSYSLRTATGVEAASVAAARALETVTSARLPFSQAATAFPQAGFEHLVAYADARAKALRSLAAAAQSWLAGDKTGAAASYALYSASAAKANTSAVRLPYAPGAATGSAFRKIAGPAEAAYAGAKARALAAEKALNE